MKSRKSAVRGYLSDYFPCHVAMRLQARLQGSQRQPLRPVRLARDDRLPRAPIESEAQSRGRQIVEHHLAILRHRRSGVVQDSRRRMSGRVGRRGQRRSLGSHRRRRRQSCRSRRLRIRRNPRSRGTCRSYVCWRRGSRRHRRCRRGHARRRLRWRCRRCARSGQRSCRHRRSLRTARGSNRGRLPFRRRKIPAMLP